MNWEKQHGVLDVAGGSYGVVADHLYAGTAISGKTEQVWHDSIL